MAGVVDRRRACARAASLVRNVAFGCALAAGLLAVGLLASGAATAQKARDTLRIAFVDPIDSAVLYDDPKPETSLISGAVFDSLLCFDPRSGEIRPQLAQSWRRVDDVTIDFTLRRGVKFHDGSEMDADDVVYTLNWIIDPKTKYRFAANFAWMDKATKIDRYTVRVTSKYPTPMHPLRLAVGGHILPAKIHSRYAEPAEFGRKSPIGTGPYRVVSLDRSTGVVLERNPLHAHGDDCKPSGSIARVEATPVPDTQTQIAHLMTGGVDLLHVADRDQVDMLLRNPDLTMTANQALAFHYLAIDALNRSGAAAPLTDPRVREAIVRALDRDKITRAVVAGGEAAKRWDMFCMPIQRGCAGSPAPFAYDPARARALLAEAGFPDGFPVELAATPGSHELASAIAGALRVVGVRATVAPLTFAAYRQMQVSGKLQMLVGQWTSGGYPDAASTADFFFSGGARDSWRDAELLALEKEGLATIDEAQRKAIYARLFDKASRLAYVLPISTKPDVFVHARTLQVATGSIDTYGADLVGMRWR